MLTIDKIELFDHLIEQHINEAAFLWMQRALAVSQTHFSLPAIRKLELRINNHLKGLLLTPEQAWIKTVELASNQDSGEIFVLAMLAFHSGESDKIALVIKVGASDPDNMKALISALGWLPDNKIHPLLKAWIEDKNETLRCVAIATCSVRRIDPRLYLNGLFKNAENVENIPLYCRMLRLAGELRRHDLVLALETAQQHSNPDVIFWANWSTVLLGDISALDALAPYALKVNPHQLKAIDIAFRCLPGAQAWEWMNKLVKAPQQTAPAIIALSTLGDPHGMNWLLARMAEPIHAKIAGHAFNMITGVDLAKEGLANYQAFDVEYDDEEIPLINGYENLPTPQVEKVSEHWQKIRHQFRAGSRYFLGQPITLHSLQQTIHNGFQGQRLSACLELALRDKNHMYPNAKATQSRQGMI